MATPAVEAVTPSTYQSGTSSATATINPSAGANLYVGVALLSVAGTSVSAVDFNGAAFTKVRHNASVSGACRAELWKLENCAGGSHDVTVTLSASVAWAFGVISMTGAATSTSVENDSGTSATNIMATDASVTIVTVTDNDLCVDIVATDDTAITVGADQTERVNVTGTLGSCGMSTEPKTTAGSVTMSWTNVGAGATWSTVAGGVKLAVAVTQTARMLLLGVGA